MYDAIDVANYIVYYCNEILHKTITNLQLQKILYYVQAAGLVRGERVFFDDIQAWKYGPVVEEVYHEFKYYGDRPITKMEVNIFQDDEYIPEHIIDESTQCLIDDVVEELIKFSGYRLIQRTHEETPWIEAYEAGHNLDIEVMRNYFNGNAGRIYGE